jgi:3-deoxy-D-arabino-heptulosonate 7-phosphate (DAHP) synthase class II
MSITEARRTEMHIGLRESLGPRVADSLMEHLPPSGWADVARQSEVNLRFEMVDRRFEEIDRRLDAIEARMRFMIASGLTIGLALFGLQVQILLSLP